MIITTGNVYGVTLLMLAHSVVFHVLFHLILMTVL